MSLQTKIEDILLDIGVPANLLGYRYLVCAVTTYFTNPESCRKSITKFLYPTVAEVFKTTSNKVERAIRHSIGVSFGRINPITRQRYFGSTIDKKSNKPTNSEFIATIAMHLKRNMEEVNV